MNLLTVLVLSMLILVESSTATEDRTFDKKSDTNGKNEHHWSKTPSNFRSSEADFASGSTHT